MTRMLACLAAGLLGVPAGPALAQAPADTSARGVRVRRIVLLRPDTTRPPSFPDTTWSEQREAPPGTTAGVRIEVIAPDAITAALWLGRLDVSLYRADGRSRDTTLLAPAFFRGLSCAQDDCRGGGAFAAFGYAGPLPAGDTLLLLLSSPDSTIITPLWRRSPPRFALGASIGAALPLNAKAGHEVVRRVGLNGRLLLGNLRSEDFRCTARRWPLCVVRTLTYLATLPADFVPNARRWQGPFVVEGDFLLGLVALQVDTLADTTMSADSAQAFRESSEGYVRIELPVVDFGGDVALRAYAQGGFVTVRSAPNYWAQQYFGLRLGMDAVDPSGRQSFVEMGYGLSENLRPSHRRVRVAVQLRVPATGLIFQFNVNFRPGRRHLDPQTTDSPVVLSASSALDFSQLLSVLTGNQDARP